MCDWRPAVKHTRVCSFMCFSVRVCVSVSTLWSRWSIASRLMNGGVAWWSDRYGGFCVWRTGAFCWAGNPIKTLPATGERMERAHTAPVAYKRKKGRSTFRFAPHALTLLQLWGLATTLPSMAELELVLLEVSWTQLRSINSKRVHGNTQAFIVLPRILYVNTLSLYHWCGVSCDVFYIGKSFRMVTLV